MSHLKVITDKPSQVFNLKTSGTLLISPQLAAQITALHAKCGSGNEWSGVLLYRVISEDISKPENFRAVAEGVFPMDFGTSGYTEYDHSETSLEVFERFPKADPESNKNPWKWGQIHSHHRMDAFFSGTDTDELKENAGKYTYYLSLIVNLAGQYCAKVAFIAKTQKKVEYRSKNKWARIENEPETVLVTFDLKVKFMLDEWFDQRLTSLNKPKHIHNPTHYPSHHQQQSVGFDYSAKKGMEVTKGSESQNSSVAKKYSKTMISGHRDKMRDTLPYLLFADPRDAKNVGLFFVFTKLISYVKLPTGLLSYAAGVKARIPKFLDMYWEKEIRDGDIYMEEKLLGEAIDLIQAYAYDSAIARTTKTALEEYLENMYKVLDSVAPVINKDTTLTDEAKSFAEEMSTRHGDKSHEDALTAYYARREDNPDY